MKNRILIAVLIITCLIAGTLFGRFLAADNITTNYSCLALARFHADLLIREYGIAFETNATNPNRDVNQRASDLNAQLLETCNTDPTKL
ncbi:hypothetical protein H3C66_05335 [Patescibacteria group bacterium]|nr:hypothetical protein [Patescibacteria group bacterium]